MSVTLSLHMLMQLDHEDRFFYFDQLVNELQTERSGILCGRIKPRDGRPYANLLAANRRRWNMAYRRARLFGIEMPHPNAERLSREYEAARRRGEESDRRNAAQALN